MTALYLNNGTGVFRRTALPAASQVFLFLDANSDGRVDLFDSFPGGPGGLERHQVQLQIVAPLAPTELRASHNRRDGIVVNWRPVRGASAYQVWRSRRGVPRRLVARTVKALFDGRLVVRGIAYTYVVRATHEAGLSRFSTRAVGKRR